MIRAQLSDEFIFPLSPSKKRKLLHPSNIHNDLQNHNNNAMNLMNRLPNEMIGVIASFLKHSDYFRFSHCNQIICNIILYKQPQLHSLNALSLPNPISLNINMNAFRNIKELIIDIKYFNSLSPSNQLIWGKNKTLQKLHLRNHGGNGSDIISFTQRLHLINTKNIHTLKLSCFSSLGFLDILRNFKYIKHLILESIKLDAESFNYENLICNFPNLKSLLIVDAVSREISAGFIMALHDQIEILDVDNEAISNIPLSLSYPKLSSLRIYHPQFENIHHFNNVKTLKSVEISTGNDIIIKVFIDDILRNNLSLERFCIKCEDAESSSFADTVLEQMELSLMNRFCYGAKSDALFIEMCFEEINENKMGLQIFRLINALKISNVNEWHLKINKGHFYPPYIDIDNLQNMFVNDIKIDQCENWLNVAK